MAGKTSAGWRVLHRRSHTSAESDEICFDVNTPARGRRIAIDDACGDSPPPPGDPRLGADRSSAGEVREQKRTETRDWGQIGTVRFVAESTGCGQRKYTKIMGNRPRRLPNEALRPPKAAREASRAARGPLRALRGGFCVVSRLPRGRKKEGPEKWRSISLYFEAPFCSFSGIFD